MPRASKAAMGWYRRQSHNNKDPMVNNVHSGNCLTGSSCFTYPRWLAAFVALLKTVPFVLGKIDDLLKNENRHNILNYIYSNPGATVAEVAHAQSIERGTVKYHLYKLETEGKIVLNRMGKYSRIFRNSHTYSDFDKVVLAHLQNQTSRSVLLLVLEQPGITNQEMAERLGIEKSAIHWHVDKFLRDGLISYRRDGKFKRYFIGDNSRLLVEKFTDRPT